MMLVLSHIRSFMSSEIFLFTRLSNRGQLQVEMLEIRMLVFLMLSLLTVLWQWSS